METLFLHGFNSGPGLVPKEWHTPQLDYSKVEVTLDFLREYIKEKNISYIVGKSIGAYFALILYNEDPNTTLFLINPSLKPYETLKQFEGTEMKNYKDPSIITKVPTDFTDELRRVNPLSTDFVYYTGMLFVEFGDKVVDQVKNYEHIHCMKKLAFENGDHAFTQMPVVVDYINTFIKYDFA